MYIYIYIYISQCKYQVKPHSCPWLSAIFAAATAQKSLFCLHQPNKFSESKVKLRKTSNICKRVLETAKLAYGNKTKGPITSQKLGSEDFWQIANSFLNKAKSATPLLNSPEVLFLLHLIKQNCFLKAFLRTLTNLDSSKASGPHSIPVVVFSRLLESIFVGPCFLECCGKVYS